MRVIETSHPVMALDYTPCGRFLVYVESQRHYRRVQEGRSERLHHWQEAHVHWHDLASGSDYWKESLLGEFGFQMALAGNRIALTERFAVTETRMTLYECRQDGLRPLESKLPGSGNGFLAISKDARYIALRGNEDNRPHIRWQHTSNIESQGIFRTLHGAGSARFSNDSKLLATLGGNHLTIWDMTSHECVKTATVPIPPVAKRAPRRLHWTRIVEHSPDFCNVFICRGNESYLCEPGAERPRFALTAAPSSVAYSPDNRFLALALLPRWITCLEIWDIAAARCQIAFKWPFTDHRNLLGASCVAFSPYGTTVAVGGGPGIVIWDFDET